MGRIYGTFLTCFYLTVAMALKDSEEITNIELADAFQQMWAKKRYNEIFFMIDTCQVSVLIFNGNNEY